MKCIKLACYSILLAASIWFADVLYNDVKGRVSDEFLLSFYRICVVDYEIVASLLFGFVFGLLVLNVVRYIVGRPSGSKVSQDKEDSEKGGI